MLIFNKVISHLFPLKYLSKTELKSLLSDCIASNNVIEDWILNSSGVPSISWAVLFSMDKNAFVISKRREPSIGCFK